MKLPDAISTLDKRCPWCLNYGPWYLISTEHIGAHDYIYEYRCKGMNDGEECDCVIEITRDESPDGIELHKLRKDLGLGE